MPMRCAEPRVSPISPPIRRLSFIISTRCAEPRFTPTSAIRAAAERQPASHASYLPFVLMRRTPMRRASRQPMPRHAAAAAAAAAADAFFADVTPDFAFCVFQSFLSFTFFH